MNLRDYIDEMLLEHIISRRIINKYGGRPFGKKLPEVIDWLKGIGFEELQEGQEFTETEPEYNIGTGGKTIYACIPSDSKRGTLFTISFTSTVGSAYYGEISETAPGQRPNIKGYDAADLGRMFSILYNTLTEYKEKNNIRECETVNEFVVSRKSGRKVVDLEDTESVCRWLESLGFKRIERILYKTNDIHKRFYSVVENSLGGGHSIELKFVGKDRRTYWGNFKTGVLPISRMVDITNIREPYEMFDEYGQTQEGKSSRIVKFIEENA